MLIKKYWHQVQISKAENNTKSIQTKCLAADIQIIWKWPNFKLWFMFISHAEIYKSEERKQVISQNNTWFTEKDSLSLINGHNMRKKLPIIKKYESYRHVAGKTWSHIKQKYYTACKNSNNDTGQNKTLLK
jgi:hypothetical protein